MTENALNKAASIPMLQTLGIKLLESSERHAVTEVIVDQRHADYYGGTHGGLLAALADTACFFPQPLIPAGLQVTTVNLSLNYMRPVSLGEHLRARANLLHLGKGTANLSISILDDEGKQVVHGTALLMIVGEASESSPA